MDRKVCLVLQTAVQKSPPHTVNMKANLHSGKRFSTILNFFFNLKTYSRDYVISQEETDKKWKSHQVYQHEALNCMKLHRALTIPRFFTEEIITSNIVHTWFLGHIQQCISNSVHLITLLKAHSKGGLPVKQKQSSQINVKLKCQGTSLATINSEFSIKPQSNSYKCSSTVVMKITWPVVKKENDFYGEKV